MPVKIILDTDIGDDIDDAIALSFALGSPEFELLGVTTVYGDVVTRARIARKLLAAWGRDDVPVVAGAERPFGFDYRPGTDPEPCSQREAVADDKQPIDRSRWGCAFIAESVRRWPGQVHVVTIGAMTNVARALCAEPALAGQMAGVASLAGYAPPRLGQPEWNVRYDPLAGANIALSGVPWTVVGADVQNDNGLRREEFDALAASGRASAKLLLDLVVLMKRNKGAGDPRVRSIGDVDRVHVADVFALASLLIPQQMDLRPGRVEVHEDGTLDFKPDARGPHRLAFGRVARNAYRGEILHRLLGERLDRAQGASDGR
ncbi:MAG TPA: nucleoside hydrolase [Phycisphaerae bacterium]|nr:nucleoside hydrolase [Phycisphaerae bacterium]